MIKTNTQPQTNNQNTVNVNVDLLSAGSKISYKDIYQLQIKLPIYKNKYYKAEEVDDVFVTMNGVFKDISEQSFRSTKSITELRQELQEKEKLLNTIIAQNKSLHDHIELLMQKIQEGSTQSSELMKLQQELNTSIEHSSTIVTQLEIDKQVLEARVTELEQELDMEKYKYETLKEVSMNRIQQLSNRSK